MPLSPPAARAPLHDRTLAFQGFRRDDGLWDIEGHLTDVKTYAFANEHRGEIRAGEPLHDMWLRVTLDDEFMVRDIEAATDAAPYGVCPEVTPNFKRMIGVKVGPGWRRAVRARLGGVEGCTHLVELLGALATVAFQTLYPLLAKEKRREAPSTARPPLLDSCHAYRADGPLAKRYWPAFYREPGSGDDRRS